MVYQIDDIVVDSANFAVYCALEPVSVEPKVFDLIVFLIEHRERVVSRKDILDVVWQSAVVSDATLSNHIAHARRVFSDDGNQQRVIKTIRGRGYQFIAPVQLLPSKPIDNSEPVTVSSPKRKIYLIPLAIIVCIAAITWVYNFSDSHKESNELPRIAVMRFDSEIASPDSQYLSKGLSRSLVDALVREKGMRVISHRSSFSYFRSNKGGAEIARELAADYMLTGHIEQVNNIGHVRASLVTENDEILWTETYQLNDDELIDIQDKIISSVAEYLDISVDPEHQLNISSQAYRAYLQARYFYEQYQETSLVRAKEKIEQVLALEPDFVQGWLLLSQISYRATVHLNQHQHDAGVLIAIEFANKALALDETLPQAHLMLATLYVALQQYQRGQYHEHAARELAGEHGVILAQLAGISMDLGRLDEAAILYRRAISLDPLHAINYYNYGLVSLWRHQLDDAETALEKYYFFQPDAAIKHATMASIYLWQGRFDECLSQAHDEPNQYWSILAQSYCYFALKDMQQAGKYLEMFIVNYQENHPATVASIYAFRDDKEQAFLWLEKAFRQQDPMLTSRLNFTAFKQLHQDKRWRSFIEKVNLPPQHWLLEQGKPALVSH